MADTLVNEKTIQSWGIKKIFHTPVLSRDISRMPYGKLSDEALEIHGWIADYCGYLAETVYGP